LPTIWRRYPQDGGVGVFSYKMAALPTRWRRGSFCLQDGGVSGNFTHKMATIQAGVVKVQGQNHAQILKSHARTVVRGRCKGDDESQWEMGKFDPRHPKTP